MMWSQISVPLSLEHSHAQQFSHKVEPGGRSFVSDSNEPQFLMLNPKGYTLQYMMEPTRGIHNNTSVNFSRPFQTRS